MSFARGYPHTDLDITSFQHNLTDDETMELSENQSSYFMDTIAKLQYEYNTTCNKNNSIEMRNYDLIKNCL